MSSGVGAQPGSSTTLSMLDVGRKLRSVTSEAWLSTLSGSLFFAAVVVQMTVHRHWEAM